MFRFLHLPLHVGEDIYNNVLQRLTHPGFPLVWIFLWFEICYVIGPLPSFFHIESLIGLELDKKARLVEQQAQGSTCVCLYWDCKSMPPCLAFEM